jgi:hypothetical protein
MRPRDTSPETWRVFLDLQRLVPPPEKLRLTLEYSDFIREMAESGLRQRYPAADEREIYLRKAQLILGSELAERTYRVRFDNDRIRQNP